MPTAAHRIGAKTRGHTPATRSARSRARNPGLEHTYIVRIQGHHIGAIMRREPAGSGNEYRCSVDDQDLSRVVLFNGGGRASANATPEMRALDQQARSTRLGIWRAGDGDDD